MKICKDKSNFSTYKNSKKNLKSKKIRKSVLFLSLLIILSAAVTGLCACNSAPAITEGVITYVEYGNPIFESQGNIDFRIAGNADYFIKVEDGTGAFQWFRVLNIDLFKTLKVGEFFVYDRLNYKPQNSFLQRY